MENIIKSFATQLYSVGTHTGYLLKFKHIGPICKKWSKNRDPDLSRVNDMVEYYKKGGYIPKIIHVAELHGEGLVCYDGNHRREMLHTLDDETLECIVDVMFNASHEDIFESFESINRAIDVPEIYLDDSLNIRDDVLELVKKYETKYKPFVSKASKCRPPNFNRDVFTENITNIYKYLNGTKTVKEIEGFLETLNTEYAKNKICKAHSKYKEPVTSKCDKYKMWLFLEREIPSEHVQMIAQRKKFGLF